MAVAGFFVGLVRDVAVFGQFEEFREPAFHLGFLAFAGCVDRGGAACEWAAVPEAIARLAKRRLSVQAADGEVEEFDEEQGASTAPPRSSPDRNAACATRATFGSCASDANSHSMRRW